MIVIIAKRDLDAHLRYVTRHNGILLSGVSLLSMSLVARNNHFQFTGTLLCMFGGRKTIKKIVFKIKENVHLRKQCAFEKGSSNR